MSSDNYTGANDAGYSGASESASWIPTQRTPPVEPETMLLPIYQAISSPTVEKEIVPSKSAEPPRNPDKLPSDERNMLIFVSFLLAAGTLAIVAMASIGR